MSLNIQMNYGTLTTFSKNDKSIVKEFLNSWEKLPLASSSSGSHWFLGCFGGYFSYHKDSKLYFSFPALPLWYPNLLEQFNNEFKNIQYRVVKSRNSKLYIYKSSRWGSITNAEVYPSIQKTMPEKLSGEIDIAVPIITIDFDKNYSEMSVKYLQYFLSILVRMLSISELYLPEKYFLDYDKAPKINDYLEFITEINNKQKGYRSLSERNIDKEMLLTLDNIDAVNKSSGSIYSFRRQTKILSDVVYITLGKSIYKVRYGNTYKFLRYDWKQEFDYVLKAYKANSYDRNMGAILSSQGKTFQNLNDAQEVVDFLNKKFGVPLFNVYMGV